ncbi:MAG: glycerophosphodiester phosphodiesterase family protein, partial [Mesotoga sp.]
AGLRLRNFGFDIGRMLASIGCSVISPSYSLMTDGWVESAHQSGLKIIPWTVNDLQEMERLIDLGVDGIITDYPDRLIELVSNR